MDASGSERFELVTDAVGRLRILRAGEPKMAFWGSTGWFAEDWREELAGTIRYCGVLLLG